MPGANGTTFPLGIVDRMKEMLEGKGDKRDGERSLEKSPTQNR